MWRPVWSEDEEALLPREPEPIETAVPTTSSRCIRLRNHLQAVPHQGRHRLTTLSLGTLALVAFLAACVCLTFHLRHSSGGSATGELVGLEENHKDSSLWREALLVLEGKPVVVERVSTTPPKAPHVDVYNYSINWHRGDLHSSAVQERLQEQTYKGRHGLWCIGLNLLGFSLDPKGGRLGSFVGPSFLDIQYFQRMGANCFRLAITWERLQSRLRSKELDPIPGFEETVDYITHTLGAHVIIDLHNSEQGLSHNGLNVMRSDLANLWAAIARKWGDNHKAIFGLCNEPKGGYEDGQERYFDTRRMDSNGHMVEFWRQWAQAAINAIRKTGAKNLILVPGLHGSSCVDWTGSWGAELDGATHSGNTRLAALRDPSENLAYEVHQHMDAGYSGTEPGCKGRGVTGGLENTIEWAKKYSKKLMMTEISSFPETGESDGGTGASDGDCKQHVHDYIGKLNESGVFLGYQVWQSGCAACVGEVTPANPLNMDWYRLHEFGLPCSDDLEDCRGTRCCSNPSSKCYEKDPGWAACKVKCTPGIDEDEAKRFQTNWTCAEVEFFAAPVCSNKGEDCSKTRCCHDPSLKCYQKEKGYAGCRSSCAAGQIWVKDDPAHQTPWNCTLLQDQAKFEFK